MVDNEGANVALEFVGAGVPLAIEVGIAVWFSDCGGVALNEGLMVSFAINEGAAVEFWMDGASVAFSDAGGKLVLVALSSREGARVAKGDVVPFVLFLQVGVLQSAGSLL